MKKLELTVQEYTRRVREWLWHLTTLTNWRLDKTDMRCCMVNQQSPEETARVVCGSGRPTNPVIDRV